MKKVFLSFIILIAVYTPTIFSQLEPPIEWGEIPKEDLLMKSYPLDSNASAVILCDFGESYFNDDLDIEFSRILRVKILTEKGYEWGTQSIDIYTKDNQEIIDGIEGITYSIDANGEIVETELDDDDIFEEKLTDNYDRYKFTMPNLKPGCIIEIKYKIISKSLAGMKDWTFQYDEPVRWSEYRILSPKNIVYAIVNFGYEPWEINESEEVSHVFRGSSVSYLGNTIVNCWQYRWAVKNIPALRDEPYVTTLEDYSNRLEVQLSAYSLIGTGVHKVLNSWEAMNERLLEIDAFGEAIDVSGDIEELSGKITSGITGSKEKMIAIYNWVKNSIVWSGEERVYVEQDMDDVLESKKGSNAEISFLLLSLLKGAGISGEPVILSTRSNGKLQKLYPIIGQFNYVIVKANIGTEYFLLDATSPLRPFDLLPSKIMNVGALVIKQGAPIWINIASQKKSYDRSLTLIRIKEDGSVDGNFDNVFTDYSALKIRNNLNDKKDLDIGKEVFDVEASGILIDSVNILAKDSISVPLRVTAWFSSADYAQVAGDMIYINPRIIDRLTENPFKTQKRNFPIDYGYQKGTTNVTNIIIPSGYEIKDTLTNKAFSVGNSVSYSRQVAIDGQSIQIMTKFEIKESIIKPELYTRLRDFYARIVEAEAEQLVLAKINGTDENKNTTSLETQKK